MIHDSFVKEFIVYIKYKVIMERFKVGDIHDFLRI